MGQPIKEKIKEMKAFKTDIIKLIADLTNTVKTIDETMVEAQVMVDSITTLSEELSITVQTLYEDYHNLRFEIKKNFWLRLIGVNIK